MARRARRTRAWGRRLNEAKEREEHLLVEIRFLQRLLEKQKVESTKEQTEDKNQYNLAKQAQDYAIREANSNKDAKNADLSDKKASLADNEATRDDEEGSLAADTAQLNSVKADCNTKAQEWDVRSKTRMGEIEARSMTVKILAKVTNVRDPNTHEQPKRVYLQKGVSFLQIEDPKAKEVTLLKEVAVRTHSKALQKLATDIGAFAGPFDKIKAMIQKMIFRLMAEQKDEDDHKNWCDLELEKSNESKDDKDNRMELLNAKIATANAEVADLTKQIADDDQSVADITQYIEEEKALRKDENVATIKDAQDAQQAVADATAVLKNFYKESGMIAKEPYEFVQTSEKGVDLPEDPSTWDASYTGVTDPNAEGSGVLEAKEKARAAAEVEEEAQLEVEEKERGAASNLQAQQAAEETVRLEATRLKDLGNAAFRKAAANDMIPMNDRLLDAALMQYTNAAALDPPDDIATVIWANLAAVFLRMGDPGRALSAAETALDHDPENMKALFRGARAQLALGRLTKAAWLCDRALNLRPEDKEVRALQEELQDEYSRRSG